MYWNWQWMLRMWSKTFVTSPTQTYTYVYSSLQAQNVANMVGNNDNKILVIETIPGFKKVTTLIIVKAWPYLGVCTLLVNPREERSEMQWLTSALAFPITKQRSVSLRVKLSFTQLQANANYLHACGIILSLKILFHPPTTNQLFFRIQHAAKNPMKRSIIRASHHLEAV